MTPTVAVVIVNWNSWALLARCLQALAAQTFQDFSVTIIDNASQSEPPDDLLATYPTARLVRHPSNIGFAAANNQSGWEKASGLSRATQGLWPVYWLTARLLAAAKPMLLGWRTKRAVG